MQALRALHDEVVDLYGYMLEVDSALVHWRRYLEDIIEDGGSTKPQSPMFFGRDEPSQPDTKYQYKRTFGELIKASAKDGRNSVELRQSTLVFLYALWEDKFRKIIADECQREKNDIESDVFADINRYRQAIVHAGNELRSNPKVLVFFRKGDEVLFSEDQMYDVFEAVIDDLNRIGEEYYESDPDFTFDNPLNL